MPALLKTTQIQEPSSATIKLALDTSGGVTAGQNLTVTGTTTFTGGIVSAGLPPVSYTHLTLPTIYSV